MKTLGPFFLRARHWQLFALFMGLYMLGAVFGFAAASRPATFYDCAGPLFLIWVFPLDVWFVQPKINGLFAKSRRAQASIQSAAPQ